MKETPAYILRNCTIWADRDSKVGQASEITIPEMKVLIEDFRNAGMPKPRGVNLGYEKPILGFKFTAFDPATIRLFGLYPGVEKEFMATGAFVDEDTTTHSGVLYARGKLVSVTPGTWKPGEKNEPEYSVDVNSFKLEMDGQPLVEMTDFDVLVGGVSQYASIRAAMLL
ncbi:phage major tail tube protein [Xanthobacter sp. VTT E-85241]|uniref:phage major tail tube protein n=1 Tax=Roseixanthobacter finlandensis TaxID=3119922 RepID=UPI00372C68C4